MLQFKLGKMEYLLLSILMIRKLVLFPDGTQILTRKED